MSVFLYGADLVEPKTCEELDGFLPLILLLFSGYSGFLAFPRSPKLFSLNSSLLDVYFSPHQSIPLPIRIRSGRKRQQKRLNAIFLDMFSFKQIQRLHDIRMLFNVVFRFFLSSCFSPGLIINRG